MTAGPSTLSGPATVSPGASAYGSTWLTRGGTLDSPTDSAPGGILAKGLIFLPETWDAMMDGAQSLNHCMLGRVMEWFYGYVGGIRQRADGVGWREILIAPNPGPLPSAEVIVETPRGRVASRSRKDGATFRLETEVPRGAKATAILPSGARRKLHRGKQAIQEPLLGAARGLTGG